MLPNKYTNLEQLMFVGYKATDAYAYGEEYPTALAIPVPSRLHFTKTPDRPFAGLRVALKDIMDLSDLKTTGSS